VNKVNGGDSQNPPFENIRRKEDQEDEHHRVADESLRRYLELIVHLPVTVEGPQ